jgi:D-glycero-D-manno-heptose 1,7-bisphosphate phosphatase
MQDVDYCGDPKDVHVFAGATEALRRLKAHGYKLVVITNQSGIGRGYFDEQQYRVVEREFNRQIGFDVIDATYHCPHSPEENCNCRKPATGLIVRAANDLHLDLRHSFLVGDKRTDIECGRNAGMKTILVRTGYGRETPAAMADLVANNLQELAELIPAPDR